jgi:dTDP-4-dehydrorhamnose reductase
MSKIVMTGYSSSLGVELLHFFESQGHEVILLGRNKPSSSQIWFPWTLGQIPTPDAFKGGEFLIHLAWPTKNRSADTSHLAIGGSAKLFEAAAQIGVKVVFVSTLSVNAPKSIYGSSKLKAESYLEPSDLIVRLGYVTTKESIVSKLERLYKRIHFAVVPNEDVQLQLTATRDFCDFFRADNLKRLNGVHYCVTEKLSFKAYFEKIKTPLIIQISPRTIDFVAFALRTNSSRLNDIRDSWQGLRP